MNRLKLLFVGEAKAPWAAEAARHYLEALNRYVRCEVVCTRDVKDAKDKTQRMRREGQALLASVTARDRVIGLDEGGRAHGSKGLSAKLSTWLEDPGRAPCFVVGGPFGFSPEVRERFDETMSLGPYTLPHDLARVVLLEQLYRGMTILAKHPYHHD
ncbi:23S rRNA (pseudouridine(1915)-N(3))-methyltransferase RlmH [Fundidesulfovibrio agrisoli]|uniref:23S rRNA (pseudouridine(1915)-N(3))-methyltransferase RlmH n=1 Tax=Fundidesulfovibrio agrisoli TaxID=2922717 RepID=UPI001FAE426D|nr:23S rRNA (pseudouridine(1915)-N(3))-methyltransferase RlmH [Fundidesulfovibrio agrisoli]